MQARSPFPQQAPQSVQADKGRGRAGIQRPQKSAISGVRTNRGAIRPRRHRLFAPSCCWPTGPRKHFYRRTLSQSVRWAFQPVDFDSLAVPPRTARSLRSSQSRTALERDKKRALSHGTLPSRHYEWVTPKVRLWRLRSLREPRRFLQSASWKQETPPPASASARAGWGSSLVASAMEKTL